MVSSLAEEPVTVDADRTESVGGDAKNRQWESFLLLRLPGRSTMTSISPDLASQRRGSGKETGEGRGPMLGEGECGSVHHRRTA